MKFLFSITFLTFFNFNTFADQIGAGECTACKKSCSDVDQIALEVIEKSSQEFIKKFLLAPTQTNKGKTFFDQSGELVQSLVNARTSLSESCLTNYCSEKRTLKYQTSSGLGVSTANPVCDFTPPNIKSPVTFMVMTLLVGDKNIAQMNYRVKDQGLSILFKAPTLSCKENEGGTFNNKFVVSADSLTLIPDESTTNVDNTPTGAQLIRKKKELPSLYYNSAINLLEVDLGSGYQAKINLNKDVIESNNFLSPNCKGTIGRNPAKKTSRVIISPSSLIANGNKVLDTNQYKLIESEIAKLGW